MDNVKKAGTNLKRKAEDKLKTLSGEGLRLVHHGRMKKGVKKEIKKNRSLGVRHSKKGKRRNKVVDIFS